MNYDDTKDPLSLFIQLKHRLSYLFRTEPLGLHRLHCIPKFFSLKKVFATENQNTIASLQTTEGLTDLLNILHVSTALIITESLLKEGLTHGLTNSVTISLDLNGNLLIADETNDW